MLLRHTIAVVVIGCLATTSAAPASGPAGAVNADTIYRLSDDASYQEGCFDPCACPISIAPIRGTLVLGPATPGDAVDFREVREVNWKVTNANDGSALHTITGTGSYRITNFGLPRLHALDLELSIDGGPAQSFFSDFVPAPNDGSLNIPISMNGMFCYDIVVEVDAPIVPGDEIVRYRLINGSTYQAGCWPPCLCPLQSPRSMRGAFALVPLVDYGTYAEYSIVGLRFGVAAPDIAGAIAINGSGFYTLIQGFAGPIHAMDLQLSVNGEPPTSFDSGLINTDPIFPAIDIAVDMNDMVCFDIVLTMRARPIVPGAIGLAKPQVAGP